MFLVVRVLRGVGKKGLPEVLVGKPPIYCLKIWKESFNALWGGLVHLRVRFIVEALNEFLGTQNCDNSEFLAMIERTPSRDIRHTFCGVNSVARWDRV
ncbi:hypothetical protein H5410_031182 [Solanum commersonii]|uniref:Uncharacterized protein n=1 Tax=Solanum commersonii TaxID=4109 RepID=A0A9J5YKY0_SOLCO|nr:hypothetical protein H5410_031182 [Solanum commersonii]